MPITYQLKYIDWYLVLKKITMKKYRLSLFYFVVIFEFFKNHVFELGKCISLKHSFRSGMTQNDKHCIQKIQ